MKIQPNEAFLIIQEQDVSSEWLPLGFSFSFEIKQIALEKALMVKWAKGFDCSGVIGEDVVRLLNEAIVRRGVAFREFFSNKLRVKMVVLGCKCCCTCYSERYSWYVDFMCME